MPNLNDPSLKPVSFIRGGLTHGGQVHLDGTFAYLPEEIAGMSADDQTAELGAVYFVPGIRRGFTPSSETYLAAEYQKRIAQDREAPVQLLAGYEDDGDDLESSGPRDTRTMHTTPGGAVPVGYTLQNPVSATSPQGALPVAEDADPAQLRRYAVDGEEGVTSSAEITEQSTQPGSDFVREHGDGEVPVGYTLQNPEMSETEKQLGRTVPPGSGGSGGGAEPLEGYGGMTVDQIVDALENASDEQVQAVISYERANKNRTTLLSQLEG